MKKIIALLLITTVQMTYGQKLVTKLPVINSTVSVTSKDIAKVFNLDIKIPKTQEQQIGKATITDNKAIYKSVEYPVYITEKGKLFIVYPNKNNTGYSKKYIKQE